MSSLYQLTEQAAFLQSMLDSGEIDEQIFADTLEAMDVDTKIENICKMIRIFEADAEAYKKEKDRLAARQKTAENSVKRLKDSLLNYLSTTDQKGVQAGLFKVSRGSTDKVKILYEDMIPEEYLIPQPPKVDAAGIKTALKAGAEINGAELEKSYYVTIR